MLSVRGAAFTTSGIINRSGFILAFIVIRESTSNNWGVIIYVCIVVLLYSFDFRLNIVIWVIWKARSDLQLTKLGVGIIVLECMSAYDMQITFACNAMQCIHPLAVKAQRRGSFSSLLITFGVSAKLLPLPKRGITLKKTSTSAHIKLVGCRRLFCNNGPSIWVTFVLLASQSLLPPGTFASSQTNRFQKQSGAGTTKQRCSHHRRTGHGRRRVADPHTAPWGGRQPRKGPQPMGGTAQVFCVLATHAQKMRIKTGGLVGSRIKPHPNLGRVRVRYGGGTD